MNWKAIGFAVLAGAISFANGEYQRSLGLEQGRAEGEERLKRHEQNHEEALKKIGICEWARQTMCKE